MYSKKDNLLFVHIPKTGGQTILRHFLEKHNIKWENRNILFADKMQIFGKKIITEHLSYEEYINYNVISKDEIVKLDIISIVRNPYDRFLSYFYMKKNKPKFIDLNIETLIKKSKQYLTTNNPEKQIEKQYIMIKPQYLFLRNCKDVKVFKYEKYNEIEEYLKKFNIKNIKKRNVGSKKAKLNYNNDFEKCIDFVNEFFKKDFELFNYKML